MKNRFYFLDIIRGLAALSVIFCHMDTSYLTQAGLLSHVFHYTHDVFINVIWINEGLHPGVITFIVLSGFCIHYPQAKKRHLDLNLKAFSRRRFFRIYPVYIVALILGMMVHIFVLHQETGSIQNFITNLICLTAFFPLNPPNGNPILLTVIVECILYCLYPLGLKLLRIMSWHTLLLACVVLYIGNVFWLLCSKTDPTWVQRNVSSLLCYWWIGAWAAELCSIEFKPIFMNKLLCLLMVMAYFVFCLTVHFSGVHFIKSLLLAIIIAFILLLLTQTEQHENANHRNRNALLTLIYRILAKIGERSYSLYVVHVPVLTAFNVYFFQSDCLDGEGLYCVNVLGVTISTLLLYHFVEKPMHKYAQQVNLKNTALITATHAQ